LVYHSRRLRPPHRISHPCDRARHRNTIYRLELCRDRRGVCRPLGRVDAWRHDGHVRHRPFGGLSAGPLLFGPIVQSYGYAAGFTACAVVAMTLILVMVAMQTQLLRPRTSSAPRGDSETRATASRQV